MQWEFKMTVNNITRLVPIGQSISILGRTLPSNKKKKKRIGKTGIEVIVGLALLKETANLTGSF